MVVRGDLAAREFVAFWLAGDGCCAGINVNVWDVSEEIKRLIRSASAVKPAQLADSDVPLETLT